jgi:mevalonate kinase
MAESSFSIFASAPGSLMLLGEHAVLHGHRALVCAINRRITVRLFQTLENSVRIASGLGNYEGALDALADHPSFRFVLQAIRQHRKKIPSGFELKVDSEFSADIGFGSSAAVTVATHAALMQWINGVPPEREELFFQSLETVHAGIGRGPGRQHFWRHRCV